MIYANYIKRALSIIFSCLILITLSPVLMIIAVLVRINLGSPIFFVQERVGYKEKIFKLIKFRTMTDKRDVTGKLLPDKERKTKFGDFLRKTSLDELPQMYNVLKGDMAIIGPRPLLIPFLDLYNEEQHKRHNVRPGFSCIAEVKGRNIIPWVERLALDTYYAEHVSFKLDLWIAINTALIVMSQKGVPDASETPRESIYIALKQQHRQ